MTGKNPQR